MDVRPYLDFKGECEAAFSFYERALGGTLGPIFRYEGTSLAHQVPPHWQNKVMHASITIGNQVLMGADVAPDRYETPKGFSLSLQFSDTTQAERVFGELSMNGRIVSPLEPTFWAARFGVVVDQFGITWLINCDRAPPSASEPSARKSELRSART